MRIPILCSFILSLFSVFVNQVNCAPNGLNLPSINLSGLGLTIPSASPIVPTKSVFGFPRKQLPFLPVPIVKKVTHHHIHHVIAHKGVVKSKYSNDANNGFDLDNNDFDTKNANQLNYKSYKEDFGHKADFNDNSFKSTFHKRGGHGGGHAGDLYGAQHLGDLIAQSTGQHRGRGIRGYIGGQKAEFVPLIIGIIDDGSELVSGLDTNKEFSSRKGLLTPDFKGKEYIPSKETMKLFEDLAKFGFK